MRSLRIVCAGLAAAFAVALALSGASALAATGGQIGQPLSLLAGLRPPHETKAHGTKAHETKSIVHAKTARRAGKRTAARKGRSALRRELSAAHKRHEIAKRTAVGKIAVEQRERHDRSIATAALAAAESPAQTAPANNIAPAADAPSPAVIAAAPAPATVQSNNDPDPSAVVVNGQTVQIDPTDHVNAMDLAAGDAPPAATPDDRTDTAPAPQTVLAAPLHRDADPVGSASWIAQVLAALGGAVAAGTVAWFLIGSGPTRMYG
jgi:hypothetical protein